MVNDMPRKGLIPEPTSQFLIVKCPECGNDKQIVFGCATLVVNCDVCGKPLLKPTGGKAQILGEIITELE
jgi:small subunit ribosomal protein S27e